MGDNASDAPGESPVKTQKKKKGLGSHSSFFSPWLAETGKGTK
jgi:hypothetical protein